MIKILKASAGSGKTFNLAKEYISLLLESGDPYAYRHILAVTFTNKATDEMKLRILKELDILASSPESSRYLKDLVEKTGNGPGMISEQAGTLLYNILNDYGAFSVSTIDRFFQRTLKAFSREIGQFSSYQVELDKDSLVRESVDRILDSLTEDNKQLLSWLTDSVKEQLQLRGRFSLDRELYDAAIALKNDEHRETVEQFGVNEDETLSKEGLSALRKGCESVIGSFTSEVRAAAGEINAVLNEASVGPEDFQRGFMKAVLPYLDLNQGAAVERPKDTFFTRAADSGAWFAKTKAKALLPRVVGRLEGPLEKFRHLFGKPFDVYSTAMMLKSQIYSLGLAREINESFDALMKEKNVMSLDDSNTILKGIIAGSDTPFIYEKIGVRFDHFLLDEFQDTSEIQWENFQPLLADSDAEGHENLIVGDVKQSIYRWRNSDWNLLDAELKRQFPQAVEDSLLSNWRSTANVVKFNNDFYCYAAGCLDAMTGGTDVSGIYSDVRQEICSTDNAPGNVDVVFCEKSEDSDSQMDAVMDEIGRLRKAGAAPTDIGILVRTNVAGASIASALLEAGIPVISDDSLNVKASPAVRRLTALLSYANNPDDRLNSFLASSLGIDPPEEYHSLVDLCEYFIRSMKKSLGTDFGGEVPYLQAFMDVVQDWSQLNGNSLPEFIAYWDTVDPKISSPDDADAVRIMTIHKSKGLSFPYVIFPYSEAVKVYKADSHWCRPDVEGTALEDVARGVYRVSLSSSVEHSLFAGDYRNERLMQMVDAINAYYVATTRAEKGMTIISAMPSKKCCDAVAPGAANAFTDMSQILYWYARLSSGENALTEIPPGDETGDGEPRRYMSVRYRLGIPYEFHHQQHSVVSDAEKSGYPSFPLNPESVPDGRLKFSTEAGDFFSSDGQTGIEASGRLRGIVLHDILSSVIVPDDLEGALEDSFASGSIDLDEMGRIRELLSARIGSAVERGWFPLRRECVRNETSIIGSDGETHRPDRVIVDGDRVVVVDYKFGRPSGKYLDQIRGYAQLYRDMGYSDVSASLWYVVEDKVVTI